MVSLQDLPAGTVLGSGGFAKVFDLNGFDMPDEAGPFVLKRYHSSVLGNYPGISAALSTLIQMRTQLTPADRQRLDSRMTWPLLEVRDGDQVIGFVMRRLPARYFFEMVMTRGNRETKLRHADMYFCSEDRSRDNGLAPFEPAARVLAVARFAAHLEFLHHLGLTVGDIQGTNVVVDPNQGSTVGARICMYDCDSFRLRGSVPAIPQPHAWAWEPPELIRLRVQAQSLPAGTQARSLLEAQSKVQTPATDVYKFGLFMVRMLALKDGVSISSDVRMAEPVMARPDLLGPSRTADLLHTLSPNPADRPTMAEVMATFVRS